MGPSEICVCVSTTYLESHPKYLRGKHALKHQARNSSVTHACCKAKSSQCAFFMHTSQSFCCEKLNPRPPIGTLKTTFKISTFVLVMASAISSYTLRHRHQPEMEHEGPVWRSQHIGSLNGTLIPDQTLKN